MTSQRRTLPNTHVFRGVAAALVFLPLSHAQTQQPVPNIQGHSNTQENHFFSCLELQCPVVDGSNETDCRLGNQSLNAVGMTQSDAKDVVQGASFTWTVGMNHHANVDERRPVEVNMERIFYLGKQFDVPEDTNGCAFYMTRSTNNANIFPPPTSNQTYNFAPRTQPSFCRKQYLGGLQQGDCAQALKDIFAQAIARIGNAQPNSTFPPGRCEAIATFVENNIKRERFAADAGCNIFTDRADFLVKGVPITGKYADDAIPSSAGAVGAETCWPTYPRTNNLTRVFSYNISVARDEPGQIRDATDGETPVWTAMWNMTQTETEIEINAQDVFVDLVCLRPIDMNKKLNEGMSSGVGEDGRGAANSMVVRAQVWSLMSLTMVVITASWLL